MSPTLRTNSGLDNVLPPSASSTSFSNPGDRLHGESPAPAICRSASRLLSTLTKA